MRHVAVLTKLVGYLTQRLHSSASLCTRATCQGNVLSEGLRLSGVVISIPLQLQPPVYGAGRMPFLLLHE
jgi:hypothetical protein